MNKSRKQLNEELESHLKEQLDFLVTSCREYDKGKLHEAKRIASVLRLLLHDTKFSKSLLSQLHIKSARFVNTGLIEPYSHKDVFLGLVQTRIEFGEGFLVEGKHLPLINFRPDGWPRARTRPFSEWWNQLVIIDTFGVQFSRRELVLALANTDGGAHVDSEIDSNYARLSRDNSTGFAVGFNDDIKQITRPELPTIRQIAHEVLLSLKKKYPFISSEMYYY